MVENYDKQRSIIVDEQKTLMSEGMTSITDKCRFRVRVQTDDDYPGKPGQVYLQWVSISVGVHSKPEKGNYRAIQIFQDKILLRGQKIKKFEEVKKLPLDITLPGPEPVKVSITESNNVVTVSTEDCPYELEFTRGGFESKMKLSVGARYKPENNNGVPMRGMCGDCNGVQDDYRLCDDVRTDVSDEPDKFLLMSESCADGKHQRKDDLF